MKREELPGSLVILYEGCFFRLFSSLSRASARETSSWGRDGLERAFAMNDITDVTRVRPREIDF